MKKPVALRHGTTELPAKAQRGELVIAFRPFIAAHVRLIHSDHLHGLSVGDTADRLMGEAIMREVKKGRCPLLWQDGKGGLRRADHMTPAADAEKLRWFATRTTMLHDTERDELRQIAARLWFDATQNAEAANEVHGGVGPSTTTQE